MVVHLISSSKSWRMREKPYNPVLKRKRLRPNQQRNNQSLLLEATKLRNKNLPSKHLHLVPSQWELNKKSNPILQHHPLEAIRCLKKKGSLLTDLVLTMSLFQKHLNIKKIQINSRNSNRNLLLSVLTS